MSLDPALSAAFLSALRDVTLTAFQRLATEVEDDTQGTETVDLCLYAWVALINLPQVSAIP